MSKSPRRTIELDHISVYCSRRGSDRRASCVDCTTREGTNKKRYIYQTGQDGVTSAVSLVCDGGVFGVLGGVWCVVCWVGCGGGRRGRGRGGVCSAVECHSAKC